MFERATFKMMEFRPSRPAPTRLPGAPHRVPFNIRLTTGPPQKSVLRFRPPDTAGEHLGPEDHRETPYLCAPAFQITQHTGQRRKTRQDNSVARCGIMKSLPINDLTDRTHATRANSALMSPLLSTTLQQPILKPLNPRETLTTERSATPSNGSRSRRNQWSQ